MIQESQMIIYSPQYNLNNLLILAVGSQCYNMQKAETEIKNNTFNYEYLLHHLALQEFYTVAPLYQQTACLQVYSTQNNK